MFHQEVLGVQEVLLYQVFLLILEDLEEQDSQVFLSFPLVLLPLLDQLLLLFQEALCRPPRQEDL